MTQTPLKLIVPLPDNDVTGFRRASLSRACGGNDTIGDVLNFFVYKASGIAQHLNLEEVDFVRIEHCTLDDILEKVKVSKRTLHGYIKQLEAWGYVKAYPYHQTYDIYFQKITNALTNPPAPPPTKLRGRHVLRALSPDEQMVKLQSRYAELEKEMSKLTSQMSKLTFEMLVLTSQMSNLTFQKSKLTSPESCEAASNQEVMGDFGEDRIIEYKESKEGEEEGEHTPLSCSLSLSVETESQEQVKTGTGSEQNTGAEIPSTEKTSEPPESQNPFHVPGPEKKTPPAWIKHLPIVRSTQYKMPDKLFVQPKEGQVPEPRPLTRRESERSEEQERAAIWKAIEDVFHTTYTHGVRSHISNTKGMDALIEDHFTPDDVRKALMGMETFHRNNLLADFSLEKLHRRLPGLLAAKESPPVVYSSRPIETIPPPTGGGWGRRLDSGTGMIPGGGRVRHD